MKRSLLCCALSILLFNSSSYAGGKPFRLEIDAIQKGNYHQARISLQNFLEAGCDSRGYYLLAVAYSKLRQPTKTAKAAFNALDCAPALNKRYRSISQALLEWGLIESNRKLYEIDITYSTADVFTKDLDLVLSVTDEQEEQKKLIERSRVYLPTISSMIEFQAILDKKSSKQLLRCQFGSEVKFLDCPEILPIPDGEMPDDSSELTHK